MTWFKRLTGFEEESPEQVRSNLILEGDSLISLKNGTAFKTGKLEQLSLAALRERAKLETIEHGTLQVTEVLGNVQHLHCDPSNQNALFQVASQFNLLEMVHPGVNPEQGVGIYEDDLTQGPACAMACGAATIYRNYFVPVKGQTGQTEDNQLNCLEGLEQAWDNESRGLWQMQNGYCLPDKASLEWIHQHLETSTDEAIDNYKSLLKIGLQSGAQVTISEGEQQVTQAFCSALPAAYSSVEYPLWESFAQLVLEAAYEATFCAALINLQQTGCNKVYLTLLGGGAFGNQPRWIVESLQLALNKFRNAPLEVQIVSYHSPNPLIRNLVTS